MAGDESQPKTRFKRLLARFRDPLALQAAGKRMEMSLQAKAGVKITSV